MKRILALLLVLAMSVGLFAGCGEQTPDVTTQPTQPTVEAQPDLQLEKAIEYLRAFYKNVAEKTPMDYTRLGTVRIGITSYDVVWSVDAPEEVLKIVKNADGSYTIDINEEAIKESTEPTPYVLTATITGKDGRELTISWNHIVPAAIDEESIEVIKKAYALAAGETLEGTYTVSGVIKAIKTPYDPSYKNITVTIEVPGAEDMPIVCYRLKGNGADKLAVGDTITVTGSFMNYNGQIQFAAGCILEAVESGGGAAPVAPENPLDILKQAYALAPGNSLPYNCTLSGVITFVDQGYDSNYGNITVTMKTHGYTIKCYRMKGDGVDQLNVNDEITVSGQITNYNGTIEFGAGCMLISRVDHEPPAAIPDPTPGTNVTIADAIAIGRGKDHDTYTDGKYYVTGKIVSIENDYYGNMHIADGNGNKLMIYGSYSEDGNTRFGDLPTKPAVGDTITVYGAIGRYGSNPQMKNAWIMGAKGDSPVIPDAPSVDQVTELVAGTPYRFGMAQGNLENAVYYLAGGMSGYYMATTADPTAAINVYVEETAGGYYFYTLDGETKLYINMVVSADGAHVNGAYEAAASTVYTYNAASNTLIATVDGTEYWFGTRNDKTYTTMGPCAVEYAGFFGQFYVGSEEGPEQPDEPEVPDVSELVADKAYKFGMAQGNLDNKVFYLAGGMDGYYMATTDDINAAIDVYVEVTEGGYYFYTLDGETKLYINMVVNGTHVNGKYEATASTVYTYNAEKNTLIGIVNDAEYWFSTRNDNTYTTMGPNKVSYNGFYGQFYDPNATEPDEPDVPVVPDEPDVPDVSELVAGKAYKFGMIQENVSKNDVYYLAGGMDGYYMATTKDVTAAIDVYVEATEGGYYFYTLDGETKLYINMVVSGTHVNGAYEATASTVYTYDAENNTLIAIVNDAEYWFGTRNDKTFTTVGPCAVSYAGFFCQFYDLNAEPECEHKNTKVEGRVEATCTEAGHTGKTVCSDCGEVLIEGEIIAALGHNFENGTCTKCGEADPDYNPEQPEEPATGLKEGVAYTISAVNGKGTLWFNGTVSSGRFNGTYTESEAVSVYAENVEGGFLLYFLNGEAKQYICIEDKSAGGSFSTDAATATVFEWNADKATAAVADDANNRAFGVGATSTYDNFSAYDLIGTYNWGQFIPVEGGSTEPECQHQNTTVEGAKEATCTEDGHTGKTVCADCGEVLIEGEIIAALGHNFENGTCTKCGEADPNYTPDEPEEPVTGLQEGVAYTISAVNGKGTLWFNGTVSSGRFNGTYTESEAVHVYIENVEGGFLLYFVNGEAKQYICIEDKSAGGSFSTDAATATVFEWNADKATAAVAEDSNNRAFGVGATSTYDNFSAYDLIGTYNWGQFIPVEGGSTEPECKHNSTVLQGATDKTCTTHGYTGDVVCLSCGKIIEEGRFIPALGHTFVDGTCTACGEKDPNYTEPEEPATGLQEGVAYTISAVNGKGTLWFNGTVSSGRFNGTYTESEAVSVYAENVEGGFLLYFLNGEAKQYICIEDKSAGGSFSTDAATATVFEWNADKATAAVADDANNRAFGVGATSTYDNFSAYDLIGTYNWGQFIPVEGGSTEPEDPFCQHLHTDIVGAVEATCTEAGHTGKTVCSDCDEVLIEGEIIAALGHNFENGTCTKCGETDPDYTEPEEPATGLQEGVAYTISAVNGKGTLWFNGTVSSGRFNGTYTESEAVSVYAENVEGGFLLYFMDGETKQYICMDDKAAGGSFSTDAATATVFEWNADKATAAVADDANNRAFGVGATSTYDNFSAYDLSNSYNWGQFIPVEGGSTEPEQPTYEHVIENGGGYAASLSEDGTQLDCFQFGNEGAIFYTNYFTEKPAEGYYELREYNGKFYYTSAPSWGVIPYESITISGKTAQLKMYDDEGMVELELTAENQYTVITGTNSLPAGVVFTFGAEYCEVLGHLGVHNCEEDVKCSYCETVICGPTGHEYGEDGVCYRCFAAEKPEQPTVGLQEGVAYTISAVNGNGTLWFNGTVSSGRFNGTYTESEAVAVYVEYVEGGFLLYFLDGETKQYICMGDSTTGGSFSTDAASATVFEWNAEKETAAVAEDSNNRAFGVGATSTYANFSAYDLSGTYNWGKFTSI